MVCQQQGSTCVEAVAELLEKGAKNSEASRRAFVSNADKDWRILETLLSKEPKQKTLLATLRLLKEIGQSERVLEVRFSTCIRLCMMHTVFCLVRVCTCMCACECA